MERETRSLKVAAFMTAPRYENVWCRSVIQHAFGSLGIPLKISDGVFYGQCMQRMLEEAVKTEVEIILTVDFDSVITSDNIMRLLSVMVDKQEIDALAAWQVRRNSHGLLFYPNINGDQVGKQIVIDTSEPFRVLTAHFGLTALRASSFEHLTKPWFWSKPDSAGGWTNAKVDDDIWFWQQWRDAGNTVYMDPECRIGHMEEMVAVFEPDHDKPTHMYPKEWQAKFLQMKGDDDDSQAPPTVVRLRDGEDIHGHAGSSSEDADSSVALCGGG